MHTNPEHYSRFGFCPQACEECDRLDREEFATGESQETALARGVVMAFEALRAQQDGGRRASR